MKTLKVPQATKKGYIEVKEGGVFDWAYPNSKLRRGRVQGDGGDICPALTTTGTNNLYVYLGEHE